MQFYSHPSKPPRVLLADDSDRIVQAVSKLLAEEFEIVGSVADGQEAIKTVLRLIPDVMVLDIGMPGLNGIRVAEILKEMESPTRIVFLSGFQDPEFIEASLAAKGSAFVFKTSVFSDLRVAIREALAGRIFVSTPQPSRTRWSPLADG